jgi:hypothetical protein
MLADEKNHGHHDLAIIIGVIRQSVDDIVEEKNPLELSAMTYDNHNGI